MLRTVEAVVEQNGSLRLLEAVELRAGERALVTILGAEGGDAAEPALLSQSALATDWLRDEEDDAWSELTPMGDADIGQNAVSVARRTSAI